MWQLQGFDSAAFIRDYWQQKPCVLRQALVDFESPVSPEELAGLACEPDVHCRLLIEKDGDEPWQLRYGPFEEQDFLNLPESHYTLLVSECEKWLPELGGLLDQFAFIPDWRVDDLMLSYSPRDGSVGPHVDEYDVFLLQAMGTRRWRFTESRIEDPELIPDLELAILQRFEPEQDIVLNPGDILYLPPGCAHHGVALEPGMTYSIGFRAPDALALLQSLLMEVEDSGLDSARYGDAGLELERHRAEITDLEIERLRALGASLLDAPPGLWRDAVGKMLSDSALARQEELEQPVYVSDLQAGPWIRHPETRLYYHESEREIQVYYNGNKHSLPRREDVLQGLRQLCEQREWSSRLINQCIDIEPLEELLIALASHGAILSADD